jgi:hypothetical protein
MAPEWLVATARLYLIRQTGAMHLGSAAGGTSFATYGRGGQDMADKDSPNRAANKDKAEGERWRSEPDTIPDSESSTSRSYDDDGDNAGGITNRPLAEEMDNQNSLPDRGETQDDERRRNNEDIER